jgi:hypothetical protein
MVVSICPPHAAEQVALDVAATGFDGIYVDANAIAPERARRIAATVEGAGAAFVDGGVIGGPTSVRDTTWLHLSGPRAAEVARALGGGPLEPNVVSDRVGDASALKMSFAAYAKGTTALLAACLATAEHHGVLEALETQWARSAPGFLARESERLRRAAAKAWRFEGERCEGRACRPGSTRPPRSSTGASSATRTSLRPASPSSCARSVKCESDGPPEQTIVGLQELMRSGEASAEEVVVAYLGRIESIDRAGPTLRAVIEVNPDALEIAAALDRERRLSGPRGMLHGSRSS